MIDSVEALGDIRVQNVLGFMADGFEDGINGVVATATGSKAVTVWLKLGFPFRFQSQFRQSLFCPVPESRDSQGALLSFAWLGYPDASSRVCFGRQG